MNYVFFGTPRFAEMVLRKLIEGGMPPSLVVTNPDRPVGRKQIITPPPVKQGIMNYELAIKERINGIYRGARPAVMGEPRSPSPAASRGVSTLFDLRARKRKNTFLHSTRHAASIKILQPETPSSSSFIVPDSKFEFAILASYGKIIPKEIIDLFPKGIIVVHPSLLPKYRGATPIQSALLGDDSHTGVSLLLMDEKVDHGSIIAERELDKELEKMDYGSLHDALAELSGKLLLETVPEYLAGKIVPKEQNHAEATFTKKFSTDDAFVDEKELREAETAGGKTAVKIDRIIRALNPEPGVWTLRGGKRIKLLKAELVEGRLKLGKIQEEGKLPRLL